MKPQIIFGLLTLTIGLLGDSLTHPAIAQSISSQQLPILIATAYTDLTYRPCAKAIVVKTCR